ncbi:unnamed protein product, partial [Urochloa humidicola]
RRRQHHAIDGNHAGNEAGNAFDLHHVTGDRSRSTDSQLRVSPSPGSIIK